MSHQLVFKSLSLRLAQVNMTDPKIQAQWATDPNHYVLGTLLDDASQATMTNIQQMRDTARYANKSLKSKPRAGSIESKHLLVSYQNCM